MTTHPQINISHVPEILRLCAKNQITPSFLSNPGIGKTQQIEAFAKSNGLN